MKTSLKVLAVTAVMGSASIASTANAWWVPFVGDGYGNPNYGPYAYDPYYYDRGYEADNREPVPAPEAEAELKNEG
jgi:hypothetical protein